MTPGPSQPSTHPCIYKSVDLEIIAALYYKSRDGAIHACNLYHYHIYMLVFHQSNYAGAIKRMIFCYATYLFSCYFMYLCVPCYCHACL